MNTTEIIVAGISALFVVLIAVRAVIKKKITSYAHAGILAVVVLFNIAIWLIEQFIKNDFEFLSISYVMSGMLLLFLYTMMRDYDRLIEQISASRDEKGYDYKRMQEAFPELAMLSNRETEVLRKLLEDKKRKEIADELCITENTVKKHIGNIFAKLEVANRAELLDKMKNI